MLLFLKWTSSKRSCVCFRVEGLSPSYCYHVKTETKRKILCVRIIVDMSVHRETEYNFFFPGRSDMGNPLSIPACLPLPPPPWRQRQRAAHRVAGLAGAETLALYPRARTVSRRPAASGPKTPRCGFVLPGARPCLHRSRELLQVASWGPAQFFSAWFSWLTLLGGHYNLSYQSQNLYYPALQQRDLPLWTLFWIICLHLRNGKASQRGTFLSSHQGPLYLPKCHWDHVKVPA